MSNKLQWKTQGAPDFDPETTYDRKTDTISFIKSSMKTGTFWISNVFHESQAANRLTLKGWDVEYLGSRPELAVHVYWCEGQAK